MVEISTRHVHVTQEHLETLFGKGYKLIKKKDLSQSGQYAYGERVTVVENKKEVPGIPILGSVGKDTQVELPLTNAYSIGMSTPIRESGDIAGSDSYKSVGSCGEVELTEGVIATKCRVHAIPEDAVEFGVTDKDIVSVKIDTPGRSLVFGDVMVRVSPSYALAMHISTDEFNAAGCGGEVFGEIMRQGIEKESKTKKK